MDFGMDIIKICNDNELAVFLSSLPFQSSVAKGVIKLEL